MIYTENIYHPAQVLNGFCVELQAWHQGSQPGDGRSHASCARDIPYLLYIKVERLEDDIGGFRDVRNAGTHFTVGPARNGRRYGFVLQHPHYRFDLELRPEIRGVMDVDLGVYEYNHVIGPFALDVLTFTKELDFGIHENTRAAYEYALQAQDDSSIRRLE